MDLATLQSYLANAQAAYHALMTGQSLVEIRHNEREMRYTQVNRSALVSYIADLKGQIARLTGQPVTGGRGRARPIFF